MLPLLPHNRRARRIMLDVIIALLPAVVVGVINFGVAILLPIATSVASAVFFEWAYRKFMKKPDTIGDLTAVLTGLLMAMTMPPQAPWWMPIIGTFFAIVVVKQLYGGLGKNFLNPALAGRAFLMASYAVVMGAVVVDGVTTATPLSYMKAGEMAPYSIAEMFLGMGANGPLPGCMGEVSALALLVGGLYLIWKKVISWRIPVAFIGTVAVLTLIGGKAGYSNVDWMLYNLFAGGLFLGAFFMATDYATSPVTLNGQLLYGVGCGAITVLIRYFGGFPEGVSYAILIMNLCAWAIDKAFRRYQFGVTKEDIAAMKAAKKAAKKAEKEAV